MDREQQGVVIRALEESGMFEDLTDDARDQLYERIASAPSVKHAIGRDQTRPKSRDEELELAETVAAASIDRLERVIAEIGLTRATRPLGDDVLSIAFGKICPLWPFC
ncbi:hypothetical protein [Desertimonas flava]|uniref:hypothetical protein n=1 Tax=Desertimonas flava TaxID=2064846 RepID=UPI000E34287C|nr:hypothetical protein [Desertimonas flava]